SSVGTEDLPETALLADGDERLNDPHRVNAPRCERGESVALRKLDPLDRFVVATILFDRATCCQRSDAIDRVHGNGFTGEVTWPLDWRITSDQQAVERIFDIVGAR